MTLESLASFLGPIWNSVMVKLGFRQEASVVV